MKVLGHERIVLVMNRAEKASLKNLPFDLRHWRAPASYSLSKNATDEQKANVASELKESLRKPVEYSLMKAAQDQKELQRQTMRAPALKFSLHPESTGPWHLSQEVRAIGVKSLAEIKNETPHLPPPPSGIAEQGLRGLNISSLGFPKPTWRWSQEEVDEYNQRVESYYRRYESFLERAMEHGRLLLRTTELDLLLENVGTARATGIDVIVTFPPGIILYDDEAGPKPPEAPEAPRKEPRVQSMAYAQPFIPEIPNLLDHLEERTVFYDVDKRIVQFQQANLKHHHQWRLEPVAISFASTSDIAPFEIDYLITANELPEPIRGSLKLDCSLINP